MLRLEKKARMLYEFGLIMGVMFDSELMFSNLVRPAQMLERGSYRIILEEGLWKENKGSIGYQDITLDLVCQPDRCDRKIWGFAPEFNQADHEGTVQVREVSDRVSLEIELSVNPDPWSPGGTAEYAIALQLKDNQIVGTYTGTFNEMAVSGEVSGTRNPDWPKTIPNHIPIAAGEHPRLLFRRYELPAVRQRATTPLGQAIVSQLTTSLAKEIEYGGYEPTGGYHAAGHCFLYALTGDKQASETAWKLVENSMNRPGSRLLEQSSIVAGVALAYDMCYSGWERDRLKSIAGWLAQEAQTAIAGTRGNGWNPNPQSNWNARVRGAAGLAAMAILREPPEFFGEPTDVERLLTIAERNIQRFLTIAIGDRGFGTEGDLYTRDSLLMVLPFLHAYQNVVGQDAIASSSAEWLLPHYVMRMVGTGADVSTPTYGRHRKGPTGSLFAVGLGMVPKAFESGVLWFFNRHWGWEGDRSFGIELPHEAAFALVGYPLDVVPENPAGVLGRVLVDDRKGFYVFRDRWQDENDFVTSIYLKREPLGGSWSFPEAGSFRIWGLGGRWAIADPYNEKRESENVVVMPNTPGWGDAQPIFFEAHADGSGVVSMRMDHVYRDKDTPPIGLESVRSLAVDYSGASGAPGLFALVDTFKADISNVREKTWVMHVGEQVILSPRSFTLVSPSGTTFKGTFIAPGDVHLSVEKRENHQIIKATGKDDFFVVMTAQKGAAPPLQVSGTGLEAKVTVGRQTILYDRDRIVLAE